MPTEPQARRATSLAGRVVWVTGAGRGLGRGIALAIAEAGGKVLVSDLEGAAVASTAEQVAAGGGEACAVVADVREPLSADAAVETAIEAFGQLDGLVANAGVLAMAPALEIEPAELHRHHAVNVQGVLSCCQAAARQMIAQGPKTHGAIVNVASNAGKVGYPSMAAYNATKAAVISLTRSLSQEWAEHGINVNAVCPGGVATPMLENVAAWVGRRSGQEPTTLLETMVPAQLGRHVQPIEVGRVVAFLLSDAAVVIRGQAINVDGGDTPY